MIVKQSTVVETDCRHAVDDDERRERWLDDVSEDAIYLDALDLKLFALEQTELGVRGDLKNKYVITVKKYRSTYLSL